MRRPLLKVVFVLILLSGCMPMDPKSFSGAKPTLTIERFFSGRTKAWGIFEDRFGTVRRQFVVDIEGRWDGSVLVLQEDFTYSDGAKDRRVWRIKKTNEHHYEGTADDVVGVASGVAYGNALNWQYTMDLKVGDSAWRVSFDDWMFLQPDGVLLNRARVTKWGIAVGEVTLAFQKVPDQKGARVGSVKPRIAAVE